MQNATIEYQFNACMRDNYCGVFHIEDIPIPNPKIKLSVVAARARHSALGTRRRCVVFAPGRGGVRKQHSRGPDQHCSSYAYFHSTNH